MTETSAGSVWEPELVAAVRVRTSGRPSLALLGCETRYVAVLYLQRAIIVLLLGLGIVLSLDAANNFFAVISNQAEVTASDNFRRLAYYMLLRGAYNLPSMLPIAALVGVIWAEYRLAVSRERFMIFNSGRDPMLSLAPALMFGLIIGIMQFAALGYIRPAAVEAQGIGHFRYYGIKFDQPIVTDPKWLVTAHELISARIAISDTVFLRDALIYRLDDDGHLTTVINAAVASPGEKPGQWTFERGSRWDLNRVEGGSTQQNMQSQPFARLEQSLALDPLWVKNLEVAPPLLSQADLDSLAAGGPDIPQAVAYQAARDERFAEVLLCVGISLLGASLSLRTFSARMTPLGAVRAVICGAVAYVAADALPMFGTYGTLPSWLAAWGVPVGLVAVSALLMFDHTNGVLARQFSLQRTGPRLPPQSPVLPHA